MKERVREELKQLKKSMLIALSYKSVRYTAISQKIGIGVTTLLYGRFSLRFNVAQRPEDKAMITLRVRINLDEFGFAERKLYKQAFHELCTRPPGFAWRVYSAEGRRPYPDKYVQDNNGLYLVWIVTRENLTLQLKNTLV